MRVLRAGGGLSAGLAGLARLTQACQAQLWLYWGNSSASDASGTFTASSPYTGELELLAPRNLHTAVFERPDSVDEESGKWAG